MTFGLVCALLACGPQVDIDDAGDGASSGEPTSGLDGSGDAGPGSATAPTPSTTAAPCPPGGCDTGDVPPNPTTMTTASDVTVTTTEPPPPPGGACEEHIDCRTNLCLEYSDAPPDRDAYCENASADGATRFTGTVRDLVTQSPIPGAEVTIASALNAATNPQAAPAFVQGIADFLGRIDATSEMPVSAAIAVMALAESPQYFLSITAVADPNEGGTYGPGNDVHDLWAVHEADLALWTERLAIDPAAAPHLPLGDAGGFVGVIRDPTGAPLAGATVTPSDVSSTAVVRYPLVDGMSTDATSELGLFIVLAPQLGEIFTVTSGEGLSTSVGSGSVDGAVYTAGVVL